MHIQVSPAEKVTLLHALSTSIEKEVQALDKLTAIPGRDKDQIKHRQIHLQKLTELRTRIQSHRWPV
jgi:hypothetical protein